MGRRGALAQVWSCEEVERVTHAGKDEERARGNAAKSEWVAEGLKVVEQGEGEP